MLYSSILLACFTSQVFSSPFGHSFLWPTEINSPWPSYRAQWQPPIYDIFRHHHDNVMRLLGNWVPPPQQPYLKSDLRYPPFRPELYPTTYRPPPNIILPPYGQPPVFPRQEPVFVPAAPYLPPVNSLRPNPSVIIPNSELSGPVPNLSQATSVIPLVPRPGPQTPAPILSPSPVFEISVLPAVSISIDPNDTIETISATTSNLPEISSTASSDLLNTTEAVALNTTTVASTVNESSTVADVIIVNKITSITAPETLPETTISSTIAPTIESIASVSSSTEIPSSSTEQIISQEPSSSPEPITTQETSSSPELAISQEASSSPEPITTEEASSTPEPAISQEASSSSEPITLENHISSETTGSANNEELSPSSTTETLETESNPIPIEPSNPEIISDQNVSPSEAPAIEADVSEIVPPSIIESAISTADNIELSSSTESPVTLSDILDESNLITS